MKRTPVIITLAGMAALAVTGTALAAAQDDGAGPQAGLGSAVPTATPTDGFSTDDPTAEPTPDDSATSTTPPLSGDISAAEARRIALAEVGGGTVTKTEAEFEHGFSTWKVEVVRGGVEHDIYVDRATGTVIKADADDRVRDDSATHDADDDKGGDRDDRGGHGRGSDD
jgi:uncharacterized membrane protein YkoI